MQRKLSPCCDSRVHGFKASKHCSHHSRPVPGKESLFRVCPFFGKIRNVPSSSSSDCCTRKLLAFLYVGLSLFTSSCYYHLITSLSLVLQMGFPRPNSSPWRSGTKSDSSLNPSDLVVYLWILCDGLMDERRKENEYMVERMGMVVV